MRMKKLLLSLLVLAGCTAAQAFDFDGIDLNGNVVEVTRQISQRGYVYNTERDCLVGTCQGTEIYLSINYRDSSQKNKIGQLVVDVPMTEKDALDVIVNTFNVVYHQVAKAAGSTTYQVSVDGTQLVVSAIEGGVRLCYNTPYFKQ